MPRRITTGGLGGRLGTSGLPGGVLTRSLLGRPFFPKKKAGDPVSADEDNRATSTIQDYTTGFTVPRQLGAGTNQAETNDLPIEESLSVRIMTILSVGTHSLTCLTPLNEIAIVGKSWDLRGNATTRTVNGEDQVIVPAYSGLILAMKFTHFDDGQFTVGVGENAVNFDWIDLNIDGRAWAKKFEE